MLLENNTHKYLRHLYKIEKTESYGTDNKVDDKLRKLEQLGFVICEYNTEGPIVNLAHVQSITITNDGRAYIQNQGRIFRKAKADWIRYIITTLIALIALIMAAIALLAQLGLLELPLP